MMDLGMILYKFLYEYGVITPNHPTSLLVKPCDPVGKLQLCQIWGDLSQITPYQKMLFASMSFSMMG